MAAATKSKSRGRLLTGILILIGLAVPVCVIVVRLKAKSRELEIESLINDILHFSDQLRLSEQTNSRLSESLNEKENNLKQLIDTLMQKERSISNLSEKLETYETLPAANVNVERLFRQSWKTLDMLCNEYYQRGDSPRTRMSILNQIEKQITAMRDRKSLSEIEKAVDMYMTGVISRLRCQCPMLKPEDITFLSLIIAGFSPRAVSFLTGINHMYFYKKRSRLIERIRLCNPRDIDEFLSRLS